MIPNLVIFTLLGSAVVQYAPHDDGPVPSAPPAASTATDQSVEVEPPAKEPPPTDPMPHTPDSKSTAIELEAPGDILDADLKVEPTEPAKENVQDVEASKLPPKTALRLFVIGGIGDGPTSFDISSYAATLHSGETWSPSSLNAYVEQDVRPSSVCHENAACMAQWASVSESDLVLEVDTSPLSVQGQEKIRVSTSIWKNDELKTLTRTIPNDAVFVQHVAENDVSKLLTGQAKDPFVLVKVGTNTTGTVLLVDGVRNGALPVTLKLPPGEHVLSVTAPGRTAYEQTIFVDEGIPQSITLDPFQDKFPWWTVAAGLGAAGAVTSVVWLGLAAYTSALYDGGVFSGIGLGNKDDSFLYVSPTDSAELAERASTLRTFGLTTDIVGIIALGLLASAAGAGAYVGVDQYLEANGE